MNEIHIQNDNAKKDSINNPSVTFLDFFNLVKNNLQKCISSTTDCEWISNNIQNKYFCDFSIRYKNTVFSILVDLENSEGKSFLPKENIKKQILHSKNNNLIPCTYKLIVPEINDYRNISQIKPKKEGWNLFSSETNDEINLETFCVDKKVECSDYELECLAFQYIDKMLREKNLQILSMHEVVPSESQIVFRDKYGELSWVYTKIFRFNRQEMDLKAIINNLSKQYISYCGYFAEFVVTPSSKNMKKIYRSDNFKINLLKYEKINTVHDSIEKEDISQLLSVTLEKKLQTQYSKESIIFPLAHYSDFLLKINPKYLKNPSLFPKNPVLIPIKYEKEVLNNKNLGLYLYHIDDKNSEYAKCGYARPQDVIIFKKQGISIIRKVPGRTVSADYYFNCALFSIGFSNDPKKHQHRIFPQLLAEYGKNAVYNLLEILKTGRSKIYKDELADGSQEYNFVDPQEEYFLYIKFVQTYLHQIGEIAGFPQESYNKAVNDISNQNDFAFDLYHTGNTLIDSKTKEFYFIDFYFDKQNVEDAKNKGQLKMFRDVLLGIHYYSNKHGSPQPMDYLVYPEHINQYELYQKNITDKINKTLNETDHLEYLVRKIV